MSRNIHNSTPNRAHSANGSAHALLEPTGPSSPTHPTSDLPHPTYSYKPVDPHPDPSPITHPNPAKRGVLTPYDFDPPEDVVVKIIHDLAAPDTTLREIADAACTSMDGLTLWMARPHISARIDAFEAAIARKNRIAVANRTPAVFGACTRILDEYTHAECNFPADIGSARGLLLQIKNRKTALQAGRLLYQISPQEMRRVRPPRPDPESAHSARPRATSAANSTPPQPPQPAPPIPSNLKSKISDSPGSQRAPSTPAANLRGRSGAPHGAQNPRPQNPQPTPLTIFGKPIPELRADPPRDNEPDQQQRNAQRSRFGRAPPALEPAA